MITLEQHLTKHKPTDGTYCDQHAVFEVHCPCGHGEDSITGWTNHLADTWRDARTVRTPEELDALPIGTVAQEQEYRHTWIRHSEMWHCSCDGTDVEWTSKEAFEELEGLPLIILWTPEDGEL